MRIGLVPGEVLSKAVLVNLTVVINRADDFLLIIQRTHSVVFERNGRQHELARKLARPSIIKLHPKLRVLCPADDLLEFIRIGFEHNINTVLG